MDKQGQIAFDFFGTSIEVETPVGTPTDRQENTSLQTVPSITPERKLVPPAQVEIQVEIKDDLEPAVEVIDFNIIKFDSEEPTVPEPSPAKSTRGRKSIKSYDRDSDLPEIPANESDFTKQYYSIGEVALMFKVNASLLRFWETEFDIIQPRKNKKGDRHFRPVDIKNLELIYDLLRRRKLTIEGAKEYLKSNKRSREKYEMIKSLENLKSFLLEIKANL
ncbi:MAG: MerR family transcriptional regulator [Flavitalea sp.]